MKDDDNCERGPAKWGRWTHAQRMHAAFLGGAGYTVFEIAEAMGVSPRAVRAQFVKGEVFLREAARLRYALPRPAMEAWRRAASTRHVSADGLMHRALVILGRDPVMIDNVLDDGRRTPRIESASDAKLAEVDHD